MLALSSAQVLPTKLEVGRQLGLAPKAPVLAGETLLTGAEGVAKSFKKRGELAAKISLSARRAQVQLLGAPAISASLA